MRALIGFVAILLMAGSAAGQERPQEQRSGAISASGARATFEFRLQAGEIVTLTTSADDLDTVLALDAPGGRRVAENDDQEPGVLTSRIVYVARASGTHTAIVTGFGDTTGAFELTITRGLDVGLSDAARVLREERVTLSQRAPEARFTVELAADDILVATTFAVGEGLDTTLALRDANGAVLVDNDDAAEGSLNSQIIYQAARAGRYEIVASSFNQASQGELILSLAIDPNARAPFNFAALEGEVIARHEGEITNEAPSRTFPLTLRAGQTLLAISDVTSGNLDPVLRLNGPDGHPVALNDDRGDGSLNAALAFTAPAAGAYTLELSRYRQGDTTGGYRLVLMSADAAVVDTLQALFENQVTLSGPEEVIETANFRVLYTREGRDAATAAYARATADALEEVYAAQVRMGWAPPPRDPDGRYRAYVADARGAMGFMKPVQIVFDNPNTANVRERVSARGMFVIENDFRGMGKKASAESLMRATATHEFNHVVQHGYDAEEGLNWMYEATSSWIETVTVGADQDATGYVALDFGAPELCWTTNMPGHNYAQWTLLQSLADRHGQEIVVRLWENAVAYDGFETMSRTLASVGTTIPEALRRWRVQNFARDYALAAHFDGAVALAGAISRNGAWSPGGGVQELGAHYVRVAVQGARHYALRGGGDLELIGLGLREGRIEVTPLGRGGVFDASRYAYAALMVFNRAVPAQPGACTDASYSINVLPSGAAMARPQYRISAAHFTPPS